MTKPFEHAELLARTETQIALARMHRQLASVADHDALTQVWNRRRLLTALETELGRSCRLGRPVSLLLLDVDHFKRVNDLYGHPTGDAVLVDLARLLTCELRAYDGLGRMGGEEFAVVLPEVDSGDAVEIADRMRNRVELASIGGLTAGEITISIGVAQAARTRDDSVAAMYSRADQRLYEAKKLGRNRVCASARGRRYDPVVDRSSMLEPRAVPSE